jgi:hypothetical protein
VLAGSADPDLERHVDADEVVVGHAPQCVQPQMQDVVSHRPGAARQRGDELTQGQVIALDRRGLDFAAQPLSKEPCAKGCPLAQPDDGRDEFEPVAAAGLDELAIEQFGVREPVMLASLRRLVPIPKMSCQGVEILVQTVAGEDLQASAGAERSARRPMSADQCLACQMS